MEARTCSCEAERQRAEPVHEDQFIVRAIASHGMCSDTNKEISSIQIDLDTQPERETCKPMHR